MMEPINLVGMIFGKVTVIKKSETKAKDGHPKWNGICECGRIVVSTHSNLKKLKSCGRCRSILIIKKDNYFIQLTKNFEEIKIDSEDLHFLIENHFFKNAGGYLTTRHKNKKLLLHRLIMKPAKGLVVDHINHNPLDNRKINLRVCTQQENCMNSLSPKNKKYSKYRGVTWDKKQKKWIAQISYNYKKIYGGSFNSEIEAAKEYNKLAYKYHGEYAELNRLKEDYYDQS